MKRKAPDSSASVNVILIALTCVVLIIGSWLLGKRQGMRDTVSLVPESMSTMQTQSLIDQLQSSLSEKEQKVNELLFDMAAREARAQALLAQLDEQMRDNISDASDLALYRKIENSDREQSLEVESIFWQDSTPDILEVVLIQWQGRARVTGELKVTLGYSKAESDEAITKKLSETETETGPADPQTAPSGDSTASSRPSDNLRIDSEPQSFDFRFFQKIVVPIPPPVRELETATGQFTAPVYVEVRVTASDTRLGTVIKQIRWKDISE